MEQVSISLQAWGYLCREFDYNSAALYQALREDYGLERVKLLMLPKRFVFNVIDEGKYLFFKLKYE